MVNKTRCIGNQWISLPLTGPLTAINSAPHLQSLPLCPTPLGAVEPTSQSCNGFYKGFNGLVCLFQHQGSAL